MEEKYWPKSTEQKLGKLVEECGEVLAAIGKTQRWGLESVNPDLPPEKQETNREWILRELEDLKLSISIVQEDLKAPAKKKAAKKKALPRGRKGGWKQS